MKKPITAIFNDIHIKNGNEEYVYNAVKFMVSKCNELGIKEVILNGDIFDSRSFQRLSHLKCFEKILELFKVNGILCHTNVGNHDKTVYSSYESFLDVFKYHPAMELYKEIQDINIQGVDITISPFFPDKMLCEQLEKHNGTDLLVGHWSCDGSTYLGKTDENSAINKKLLSKWGHVYLGHYHNYHDVNENTTHLPSLIQDNFGEDNIKGFSIIYDDLSYEVVKGVFKEYIKVLIDLNTETLDNIKELIKVHKNSLNVIRFEISGKDELLKAFDKSLFSGTGIDYKMKFQKHYESSVEIKMPKVTEYYDEKTIRDEFKVFCKNKNYDYDFGLSLLNNFFKKEK